LGSVLGYELPSKWRSWAVGMFLDLRRSRCLSGRPSNLHADTFFRDPTSIPAGEDTLPGTHMDPTNGSLSGRSLSARTTIDSVIRTVIADDETSVRQQLRKLLDLEPGVQVVAQCKNGQQAIEAMQANKPDLLFLDNLEPAFDAFEVLNRIPAADLPVVIFTSDRSEHAVRAFEVHALDYLLKPIVPERLHRAMERARVDIQRTRDHQLTVRILELLERTKPAIPHSNGHLVIRTEGRVVFLEADEVDWIEAVANYVKLNVGKNSYLLREGIGKIAEKLDPNRFVRIHRSTIVNSNRIKELQPCASGEYIAVLKNGKELACSRGYRLELQRLMGKDLRTRP